MTGRIARRQADTLARGLGWFSIGLGVVELVAPRSLARSLGMAESEPVLRSWGAREIATGIGILAAASAEKRRPWILARLAGDALDIATLASGLRRGNPRRQNVAIALAAVAGITALDLVCAQSLPSRSQRSQRQIDYSNRSGLARSPAVMRGAARDFQAPRDMRIPEAMRPWTH